MFHQQSCIFAEYPIDPSDALRGDENALASLKEKLSTRYILFKDGEALMRDDENQPIYLNNGEATALLNGEEIFLGKDRDHAYFAISGDMPINISGKFIDLRTIARNASRGGGFSSVPSLLARGKMLLDWHYRHKFCANCGAKTDITRGGYVRRCPACENEHFPRVDPVVIMLIIKGDKCLMGRSPHFLPGMYSALAGFMEPGETIEEAVRREVLEEAKIEVGEVHYVKSQPWPFPSSLMIGAIGEAASYEIDFSGDELEDAKWFSKSEIASVFKRGGGDDFRVPHELAIARHLLDYWLYHY